MLKMLILLFTLFLTCSVSLIDGFHTGPPHSSCLTGYPEHHEEKQTSEFPAQLTFAPASYTPGQNVTVTLASKNPTDFQFMGFQITVHSKVGDRRAEQFEGTFLNSSPDYGKVLDCVGIKQIVFGHRNNTLKTNVTVTWTAPSTNKGNLVFLVTVVHNFTTYWTNEEFNLSPSVPDDNVTIDLPPEVNTAQPWVPNWSGCGSSKNCWLAPESEGQMCSGQDCQVALSYIYREATKDFVMEMTVKGLNQWVAVGFSNDTVMGEDSVVMCTASPGKESVQLGYNPEGIYKFYYRQFTTQLSNMRTSLADGRMNCQFTLGYELPQIFLDDIKRRTIDITKPHYIFLAWGLLFNDSVAAEKHDMHPHISATRVDLTRTPSDSANSGYLFQPLNNFILCILALCVVWR